MVRRHPLGWEPWHPGRRLALPGLATVIGHRGAAGLAPENTLAGFRAAAAAGASWVEFDVKLAADGPPVLMHDPTLERTTDGRGPVAEAPLATLARLDAGAWFGPAFAGEPVPTLDAALALLLDLKLGANLELKPCPEREVETAAATASRLAAAWRPGGPPLLVTSFSMAALRTMRWLAPWVPLGLLVRRLPPGVRQLVRQLGCTTLHPWHIPLRTGALGELAAAGLPIIPYTVNGPLRAARLLGQGARAIITDRPDLLVRQAGKAAQ